MDSRLTGLDEQVVAGIINILKNNIKVEEVILFGSRAKGTFMTGSDIDLALKGKDLGLNDLLDLSVHLENLDLPYKTDLINFDKIKEKPLLEHITRVGISLYSKKAGVDGSTLSSASLPLHS